MADRGQGSVHYCVRRVVVGQLPWRPSRCASSFLMPDSKPNFWPRRVKILGGFLICCLAVILFSRFFLYPNTLRGKFDRIHFGMSKSDVFAILGQTMQRPPAGFFDPIITFSPVRTVTHRWKDEMEIVEHLQGKRATDLADYLQLWIQKSPLDDQNQTREMFAPLYWSTKTSCLFLEMDHEDCVSKKTFVEVDGLPWKRFQRWLGWH